MTLQELKKEELRCKRQVMECQTNLVAAMAELAKWQARVADHKDYVPAKPRDFGCPVGLPKHLRPRPKGRFTLELNLLDDF